MKPAIHPAQRLKDATAFMARPVVPFVLLPVLMAVLIGGTVAQRFIGLYDAQRIFFASAPVVLLLAALTISLTIKFLFFSQWTRARAGINLSHLGILILLIGGLLTAISTREGNLTIGEGESASIIHDYNQREMTIAAGASVITIPFEKLKPGQVIAVADTTAKITINTLCRNCRIDPRKDANGSYKSMAQFMALTPDRPALNDEQNINGVTFTISGAENTASNGIYLAIDVMPQPVKAGAITFNLGKARRELPFEIRLEDFHAENHPGTAMARAYRSDIIVQDGGIAWPVRIEMNKPLRYKGYTFFQSSFFKPSDTQEFTVLAVVQNRAWIFPYIGTGLMAIGLLLHLMIMVVVRR